MARHVVARTSEIPPGGNKVVGIDGRDIVVFHVNGEFFALLNRCPHEGAPLDKAACVARLTSPEPGVYQRSRVGELLRCAWHGWEFDMRNGQSWFDPKRFKVRSFPVAVESGEELAAEMKKGHTSPRLCRSLSRIPTSSSRREAPAVSGCAGGHLAPRFWIRGIQEWRLSARCSFFYDGDQINR